MASSSSSTAVLVAGSALLAVAGLGYLAATTTTSRSSSLVGLEQEDTEIQAREVCEIYQRLLVALQATCQDLVQQIAPYQAHLPVHLLKAALATELERALQCHQNELLAEYDMDLDCFDDAVRDFCEHNHDWQVQQAVTKFQTFWKNCADELFPKVEDAARVDSSSG